MFFGIIIISHIPIYIFYFIYGISPIYKYIKKEMSINGYNISKNVEENKKIKKSMSFSKSNRSFNKKLNKMETQMSENIKSKKKYSKFYKDKNSNNINIIIKLPAISLSKTSQ